MAQTTRFKIRPPSQFWIPRSWLAGQYFVTPVKIPEVANTPNRPRSHPGPEIRTAAVPAAIPKANRPYLSFGPTLHVMNASPLVSVSLCKAGSRELGLQLHQSLTVFHVGGYRRVLVDDQPLPVHLAEARRPAQPDLDLLGAGHPEVM